MLIVLKNSVLVYDMFFSSLVRNRAAVVFCNQAGDQTKAKNRAHLAGPRPLVDS